MSDDIQQAPESQSEPESSQVVDNSHVQQSPQPQGSVYDAFKQLPEFSGKDDTTIARTLYESMQGYRQAQQQLRQYQEIVPKALEYSQHAQQFEEWRRAQAQAQAPQKPKWWDPPQVKDEWKQYIIRDPETGREIIAPDAPLEAASQIRNYQSYTTNFAKKFVTDPEGTLKPFIEDIVSQRAQELVQQQLGQYQAQTYVQSLEQQNADWLYDERGQITPEGHAIQQYIAMAAQYGINDPQARWQFATGMLERDLLNVRHQQLMAGMQQVPEPAAPPSVDDTNMQFLRERATRAPSRSGGATEPRAPKQKMTFEERLKGQLVKDGVI